MHIRALTAATLATLLLTACSAAATSGPPSARSLILRIPGCHKPYVPSGGVAVQARAELECLAPGAEVDVATFSSAALERSWLVSVNGGAVCGAIQGRGWAASLLPEVSDTCGYAARLARLLGGRVVSP